MTREAILAASRNIILEQGLQHLLMDEVARHCGISKKTIYELFESKEALMENLGSTFLEQDRGLFLAGLEAHTTHQPKIDFIIEHLYQLGRLIPFEELEYLKRKHTKNYHMLLVYLKEIQQALLQCLTEAQAAGLLYPDMDIHIQADLLLAQLKHLHCNYRSLQLQPSGPSWLQHIRQGFFRSTFLNRTAARK